MLPDTKEVTMGGGDGGGVGWKWKEKVDLEKRFLLSIWFERHH